MAEWIDLTRPMHNDMQVYDAHERFCARRVCTCARDGFNLTLLNMCVHNGTHMDAPAHFIEDGATIDQVEIETLVGKTQILTITDQSLAKLPDHCPPRLLLRLETEDVLTVRQARAFAQAGIKLLGCDRMSVASKCLDSEVHRILLGAGMYLIETLDLSGVVDGLYDMVCLPVKLKGCEGAPARVIVRAAEE